MSEQAVAALVVALLCGLGGLLMPAVVGWIPEPEPEREPEAEPEPEVEPLPEPGTSPGPAVVTAPQDLKEPYADIARRTSIRVGVPVVSALAGAAIGAELGWAWPLVHLVPLVPLCAALAVVDWRTRLLPSKVVRSAYLLVVAGLLVGAAATQDTADLVRAGIGLVLASGLYHLMWFVYPKGMGYGDVRLSGVLGLALGQLGWPELIVGIYAGFILGGVGGGLLSVLRIVERKAYPFGPFMVLGALVGIVWVDPVLEALVRR